jgi:hypothetical protein
MSDFFHTLAFGVGAFILGGGLIFGLLCKIAGQNTGGDDGEGCLGLLVVIFGIAGAAYFFYLALK